ncbi:MAG: hypothetical protein LBG27_10330 [Spirochaetaceae bacterium]|nr:hypothetical protein [Spirochaetaceae bacterium]
MEQTGLLNDVLVGAFRINEGRKGFAIPGKERQGRISYEEGIALALAAFQKVQRNGDPRTIILVEMTFLTQEQQFCTKDDVNTRNSLAYAIQSFRDALRSLEVVENAAEYKIAEKTYLTDPKKRVQGFPADAFYQACCSHQTRSATFFALPVLRCWKRPCWSSGQSI